MTEKKGLTLSFEASSSGFAPVLACGLRDMELSVAAPVAVAFQGADAWCGRYDSVESIDGAMTRRAEARHSSGMVVTDLWSKTERGIAIKRSVSVNGAHRAHNYRAGLSLGFRVAGDRDYWRYYYFAPSAFYKHNDVDHDGEDAYYGMPGAQHSYWREDRLTAPLIMVYHQETGCYAVLVRASVPKFDPPLQRAKGDQDMVSPTDIGSIGFGLSDGPMVSAFYPFYEGAQSMGLNLTRPSWECFRPGDLPSEVGYEVWVGQARSFNDAIWAVWKEAVGLFDPQEPALPVSMDELIEARYQCCSDYFRAWDTEDKAAGVIINCRPDEGVTERSIIEFGFTGRQLELARVFLWTGHRQGNSDYLAKGRMIADFFSSRCVRSDGFVETMYDADSREFIHWFTGILMSMHYRRPEDFIKKPEHVQRVNEIKSAIPNGSYFRCMCESVWALLLCYEEEVKFGFRHEEWFEAAERFVELLLRLQNPDGSWYNAYDTTCNPVAFPPEWFGKIDVERKNITQAGILPLVAMWRLTKRRDFLDAAVRAGQFVIENYILPVEFGGGHCDESISRRGTIVDDEGVGFAFQALLELYEVVRLPEFLHGAKCAAQLHCTWLYLWNVPLPEGSRLERHSFRSAGWGASTVHNAGSSVHMIPLSWVAELYEMTRLTGDQTFARLGRLAWISQHQLVANRKSSYGLAHIGLQEENYKMSYLLLDEPGRVDNGFEGRKGEGNHTCYPWSQAVALHGLIKILDRFGGVYPEL